MVSKLFMNKSTRYPAAIILTLEDGGLYAQATAVAMQLGGVGSNASATINLIKF